MSRLTFSSTSKTNSKSTTVVWSNIIKGLYTIIVTCLSDDIKNRLKNKDLEMKVSAQPVFLLNKSDVVSKQAIAIKYMIHTINPAVMHTRCDGEGKLYFP